MDVVASMDPALPLAEVGAHARRLETMGYDAFHVPETVHDAFTVSLLALEHTEKIVVRTAVALAFPRSPMLTAYAAWDLARFSGGRFQLGLGTQIRRNIEDRYGIAWSDPVGRMREYLECLKAIFAAFQTGKPPRFEGEHYRITLLQPYFNPGPLDAAPPALWLGGVNAAMCRLAGERAAGFVTHPTSSNPRYLSEICLPSLAEGAAAGERSVEDVDLVVGGPLAVGATPDQVAREREHQRRTLAFLYSTPAYRRTLELYGWEDLGPRLQALTREGRWDELHAHVTDEVLDALVPQGTYEELPGVLHRWYAGVATGILVPPPADPALDEPFTETIAAIKGGRR